MSIDAKKVFIIVTIASAVYIVIFLVTYHSPSRLRSLVPNTPRKKLAWTTTLKGTMPWNSTKDDNHFQTLCSNREMTIPSVELSKVHLLKFEDGIAEVTVHLLEPKSYNIAANNDVIFVWAEQVVGTGRVAGIVHARGNGSYTGHVKIFWRGLTRMKVKIAESSVNTCLRYRSLLRYGNTVYSMKRPWGILGEFRSAYLNERTRCGTTPYLYGYTDVCNFTTINDGSPWYCGQPRSHTLRCQHIYSYGEAAFRVDGVTDQEKIKTPGHGTLKTSITVDSRIDAYPVATTTCKMASKGDSWTRSFISGFLGKVWQPIHCRGPREHTDTSYRACLNDKTLVFIGDSTVRQYFEYVIKNILPSLSLSDKHGHGPDRTYHSTTVFSHYNITAYFRKHELPWHMPDAPPSGIKTTPTQLRDLALTDTPGQSLVIVLNYFSHSMAFPPSHYRQRVRKLVKGVQYLLAKKPGATILYKGPHVAKSENRWFDQHFALLYRDILFEEFRDVMDSVIYLDTWDITIAHDNENIHPIGQCMQSQIQQMMAYVCE